MRKDRLAEFILSLAAPPERAASVVGDLMEEEDGRGPVWFWMRVGGTALSLVWRSVMVDGLGMIGCALLGWLPYMLLSVILTLVAVVTVTLLWGVVYLLANHTGLELLTDVAKLRFDWPPPPSEVTSFVEPLVMRVLMPFQFGRFTARYWRGREIAASVVVMIVWPVLVVLVPFVGWSTRASIETMPLVQAFLLAGAVWEAYVLRQPVQPRATPRNTDELGS